MATSIVYSRNVVVSDPNGLTLNGLEQFVKQAFAVGLSSDAKIVLSDGTGLCRIEVQDET
jgi:hypothetical protein